MKQGKKNSFKCCHQFVHGVVPENIHTPPPRKGLEFPGGWGGSKAQENPEGGGLWYQFLLFFPDRCHYSYMLNILFAFCNPRTQTLILLTAQN